MVDDRSPLAQLTRFLAVAFTADELQSLVRTHLSTDLALSVTEVGSPRRLAEEIGGLLARRDELDGRFFSALREVRPARSGEIDALEQALGALPGKSSPEKHPLDVRLAEIEARRRNLIEIGRPTVELDRERLALRRLRRVYPLPEAGDKIGGRYTLDAPLGHGGFASVWRARDLTESRWVALKILHNDRSSDPELRTRFFRGARTMQRFDHPGIVRVYEAEQIVGSLAFMVLELVSGGDLRQAVVQRRVSRSQIGPILLAVCEALAVLHDAGVIHRDIKPSNILLSESGTPRLTDFDLVHIDDTTGGTRTGALGTVLYSAPEIWNQAHAATPAADVYSLAMCGVFALHGADLPPDVLRDNRKFLEQLDPPPALAEVLVRALSWERQERPRDAGVLLTDLRRALELDAASPGATDPEHDILYWVADERGTAETLWLSEREGRVVNVARMPGVWLAAGERIWRIERSSVEVPGFDYAGEDRWRCEALEVDSAALVEITGEARISVGLLEQRYLETKAVGLVTTPAGTVVSEDFPDGPLDLSHAVHPIASLGPFLLLRSQLYQLWPAAAHGAFDVELTTIDLATGNEVALLTPDEAREFVAMLAPRACSELADRLVTGEDVTPESLTLTMLLPSYDLGGKLHAQVQLTTDACYADSDKEWSDYTASVRLDAPRIPAALADYSVAPALLQAFWQTAPRFAGSFGWTRLARTAETRRALHRCLAPEAAPRP